MSFYDGIWVPTFEQTKQKCSVEIKNDCMTINFNSIDGLVEWTNNTKEDRAGISSVLKDSKTLILQEIENAKLRDEVKTLRSRVSEQRKELARLNEKIEKAKQVL